MRRKKRGMDEEGARERKGKGARTVSRLKSERVQLELQRADGIRKLIQRGPGGRFSPSLVLPAEGAGPVGVRIALRLEIPPSAQTLELLLTATLAAIVADPAPRPPRDAEREAGRAPHPAPAARGAEAPDPGQSAEGEPEARAGV